MSGKDRVCEMAGRNEAGEMAGWKARFCERRGSMMVEGCVFLPVMIVASVCLVFLIKSCWIQIIAVNAIYDQIHVHSVSHDSLGTDDIADALKYNGLDESNVTVNLKGVPRFDGIDDMEKLSTTYSTDIKMPLSPVDNILLNNTFIIRKWDGIYHEVNPMGFDVMTQDVKGAQVWVFPRDGEKYHHKDCRYVKVFTEEVAMSREISDIYYPCPSCIKTKPANGSKVYIFEYGYSYHLKVCPAVARQTVCMDVTDAELKGYSPCSVCGGGQ